MATAVENEIYVKELKDLAALLAKGPKHLDSLPPALQSAEFLAAALEMGRIEVGRPDHSWRRKQGVSESLDARPMELEISSRVCWTDLREKSHKSIYELLDEEKTIDPKLRLQVKLVRRAA